MIEIPKTIEEARILSNRHSDAYWFLQGDLTAEQATKCCKLISDIEEALSSISKELETELMLLE